MAAQRWWCACCHGSSSSPAYPLTGDSSAVVMPIAVAGILCYNFLASLREGSGAVMVQATTAWVTMLGAMSGEAAASHKLSGERVFIRNGLPIMPKAIHKWQYVDLADLLPAPYLHNQSAESGARLS